MHVSEIFSSCRFQFTYKQAHLFTHSTRLKRGENKEISNVMEMSNDG